MTNVPSLLKAKEHCLPKLTKESEGKWSGDFIFIQGADTQLGLYETFSQPRPKKISWEQEVKSAEMLVETVNKMDPLPNFMVVCGDLVNAFPGDEDRPKQLSDFFKVFAALRPDIPLVCLCGNHDIGDTPTAESINAFKKDFGDDYFSFWSGGCRFLVLNSQLYHDASKVPQLKVAQQQWLEDQLKADCGAKHTIVFQHIPWFINDGNEEDFYFNIRKKERIPMLDMMKEGGVSAIFCGHYHINAGGVYRGMEQVVTSAIGVQLGEDVPGFRIVRVHETSIDHEYVSIGGPLLKCRIPVTPENQKFRIGD